MCDGAVVAEWVLGATALPDRGWRRWLWFAVLAVVVAAAGVVAYLYLG